MPVNNKLAVVSDITHKDLMIRKYFAIAKDLKFKPMTAKQLAKNYYKLNSFSDISEKQLEELLKIFEKKLKD